MKDSYNEYSWTEYKQNLNGASHDNTFSKKGSLMHIKLHPSMSSYKGKG